MYRSLYLLLISISLVSCNQAGYHQQVAENAGSYISYFNLMPADSIRPAGSPQESDAADILADQMKRFHLNPLEDSTGYFHEFIIASGMRQVPGENYLRFMEQDYTAENNQVFPLPNSPDANLDASFCWAGYGIHLSSYDDLHGIRFQGKIVMILDSEPAFIKHPVTLQTKIENLAKAGAEAVIVAPQANDTSFLRQDAYTAPGNTLPIPVMKVTRKTAVLLMASSGYDLDEMQTNIIRSHKPDSFKSGLRVTMYIRQKPQQRITRNVIGYLKGSRYPARYIIVLAPFDYMEQDSLVNAESAALVRLESMSNNLPHKYSLIFFEAAGKNSGLPGIKSFLQQPVVAPIAIRAVMLLRHIADMDSYSIKMVSNDSTQIRPMAIRKPKESVQKLVFTKYLPASSDSVETLLYNERIPFIGFYPLHPNKPAGPSLKSVPVRLDKVKDILQRLQ